MQLEINRLRKRFILAVIIIVSLVMALVSGVIISFSSIATARMADQVLDRVVNAPQNFGRLQRGDDGIQLPYFVLIVDEKYAVLTSYGGYYDLSDTDSIQAALDIACASDEDTGYIAEYGLKYQKSINVVGTTNIAFVDVSSQIESLDHIKMITFSVCIGCVLLFALLALLLSKWVIKPVENSWNQQKQFVSDASHELKTPLTVITTNAEMLQLENNTDEDREKYSQNILTVSHQMRGLVEDLLNLARLEKGESQSFEIIDMSAAVNDAAMQFEPVLFELGLNLIEDIQEDIKIKGSAQRIGQLASILLDNAGKYSLPGDVKLSLKTQGKHAVLSVTNPAEPISGEQMKNIFTRFYRVDESHNEKASYGLGLSIAKSIAEAHNGKIVADYNNGIFCITATVPTV